MAIAFIGISVVIVGGKSDEELGYKVPMKDLAPDSESTINKPTVPSGSLHESGDSNQFPA